MVEWTVGRNDKTDEEQVEDVEESNTVDDLLGSLRNFLSRILGLCSC